MNYPVISAGESRDLQKLTGETFLAEQKSDFKDIEFQVHLILLIILFNGTLETDRMTSLKE